MTDLDDHLKQTIAAAASGPLRTRLENALLNRGILTFEQLRATDPHSLLNDMFKNLGRVGIIALWRVGVWPDIHSERDVLRHPSKRVGL